MAPRVMTVSGPIPPEKLGLHPPARARRHQPVAHRQPLGLLGAHARRRPASSRSCASSGGAAGARSSISRCRASAVIRIGCAGWRAPPGLNIVMGTGWYREAYYPAELLVDRRSVDDLAAEIVAEFARWRRRHRHPSRDHRRDRHRQALGERARGARAPRGGPCREGDRDGDHDPWRAVGGRPRPAAHLHRGGRRPGARRHRPCRLAPRHRLLPRGARCRARTSSSTSSGHRFATEEALEPRLVETIVELLERGYATADPAAARTCATTGSSRRTAGSGTSTSSSTSCRRCAPPRWGRARSSQMTIDNPARILTIPYGALGADPRDPIADLKRIAFLLESAQEPSYRVRAFRSAAATLDRTRGR